MSANILEIIIQGPDAQAVADNLRNALDDDQGASCEIHPLSAAPTPTRDRADPATVVAAIGLILQIPAAALAAYDLTQRLKKAKQAERLQQTAQVSIEQHRTTTITLKDGRGLHTVDARALLELAAQLQAENKGDDETPGGE